VLEAFITTLIQPPAASFAAPNLAVAPVALPTSMPLDRMEAFRKTVANRLRDGRVAGLKDDDVIVAIATEQRAIAQAISTEDFACKMTHAFMNDMEALKSPVPHDEAMREVKSILKNRAEDCKNFVALLANESFRESASALASQPAQPPKEYTLSARKIEETIRRLVQPNDPAGAEPAVHVAASARGHEVTHRALANMFRPKAGSLRAPLVDALTTAWPTATGEQIQHLAQTWLKQRHDPAHSVADGLKSDGAIYKEAMRRAELLQQEKLGQNRQAATAPSPLIQTPPVHMGTARNLNEVAMEV
jgi:hypothetical protein